MSGEPTPIQNFQRPERIVAKCQRCGREFMEMPVDRRDHYRPARGMVLHLGKECGGSVAWLAQEE